MRHLPHLPIDDVLEEVISTLEHHRQVVLQAPPGAGKSTRLPPALLDAPGLVPEDQKILVLEPRRVAARAVASRIAQERGQKLGGEVGYSVRFDNRTSKNTRLEIITEGMLLRRLYSDPLLSDVGCVILDEFHERSVHADLSIAMLKEVRSVREDLLLVVMSATLQADAVSSYLGAPEVTSQGRAYPVEIEHVKPGEDLPATIAKLVRQTMQRPEERDVLVFLPGARSIQETIGALSSTARELDFDRFPLYGALPLKEQIRAISSSKDRRRVIVATNIAETSLTVEGVTTVIDSGLVKQMRVDPSSGLNRLEEVRVALDSATQRAGRAGRVREGRALRLWTHVDEQFMSAATEAEINRVDLAPVILDVLAWSSADPHSFDWFEEPPARAIDAALGLLERLGALDMERGGFALTEVGEALAAMPTHPRQGRMLIEGAANGVRHEVAAAAAILAEEDFVSRASREQPPANCDLWARVEVLEDVARDRTHRARSIGLPSKPPVARRLLDVRDQLLRSAGDVESLATTDALGDHSREARFRRAILAGYPDRICFRRDRLDSRDQEMRDYVMVGGEPVTLAYESAVRDAPVIVATHLAGERYVRGGSGVNTRGLVRLATAVEREWLDELFPERFVEAIEVSFDEERDRVRAERVLTFDGIALERETVSVKDFASSEDVARMLAEAASRDLTRAFQPDKDGAQLLDRIACLAEWMPDLELPDLRAVIPEGESRGEQGRTLLEQWCWGKRTFAELRRGSLEKLIRGSLRHEQWSALERYAPARLQVPSGSHIRIDYTLGEPPVLAVRIQELFGMVKTPTIARGEVALMLHLLAPNYRPAQVTQDLESFWENTYPEVRKELRARYPKHPWPEDPLSASAIRK